MKEIINRNEKKKKKIIKSNAVKLNNTKPSIFFLFDNTVFVNFISFFIFTHKIINLKVFYTVAL